MFILKDRLCRGADLFKMTTLGPNALTICSRYRLCMFLYAAEQALPGHCGGTWLHIDLQTSHSVGLGGTAAHKAAFIRNNQMCVNNFRNFCDKELTLQHD